MWTYRCYVDGGTPLLWRRWYDSHPDYQGSHDAVFDTLEQMTTWKPPYAKLLIKEHRIFEVRLNGAVRHRILGFYSGAPREFVVIATCSHKGNVYDPKGIRNQAIKRKAEIESNPGKAIACDRPK